MPGLFLFKFSGMTSADRRKVEIYSGTGANSDVFIR